MVTSWKIVVSAAAIFAAGVVTGRVTDRRQSPRPVRARLPLPEVREYVGGPLRTNHFGPTIAQEFTNPITKPPGWGRVELLRRMEAQLELSPEQQIESESIIAEGERRARSHWEPAAPRIRDEIRWTRDTLIDIYTPEQRRKFLEVVRREQRREVLTPDQQKRFDWLRNGLPKKTNSVPVVPLQ